MTTEQMGPLPDEQPPPDGTPIIQRNNETGQLRILWPTGKPDSISMTTEMMVQMIDDFNDFRALDGLAYSMLEDYRNRKTPGIDRWKALQKVRRRLGLKP